MSAFYDNNITDIGRLMMGDVQMGGIFTPTRIVVGSGYLPTGKTTRTVTGVVEPVKSIDLNKKEKLPNGDCVIGGVFDNKEVTTAFYFRELAIYAKVVNQDGTETTEKLYSYGNAGQNAELIPAYSTETAVERQLDLITYIGNDAQVNLTVESGVYVSVPAFNSKMDEIDTAINGLTNTDESLMVRIGDIEKDVEKLTDDVTAVKKTLGNKVDKVEGKGLSSNDYTAAEKSKLAGIEANANKYTHPTYTPKAAGLYKVTVDGTGHVSAATAVTKGDITNLGIPAQDTVYTHPANHPASMITQDATHRFVSDAEKATYSGKANKPTYVKMTLTAAGWDKTAKTYSFEATYPHTQCDVRVSYAKTCTSAQLDAWNGAGMAGDDVGNIMTAINEVPTVDIPVILEVTRL